MEITEVRIHIPAQTREKMAAYCSITFDNCFVIKNIRLVDGPAGLVVAMPSHPLTDECPRCRTRNHLLAKYCNECGTPLNQNRAANLCPRCHAKLSPNAFSCTVCDRPKIEDHPHDTSGRLRIHLDIAHPIRRDTREFIVARITEEYHRERERLQQPGYTGRKLWEVK